MITIENIKAARVGVRAALHVVRRDGVAIGLLEKWRNTATETHPWKAFWYLVPPGSGRPAETEYLGAFYRDEGGKRAAIQAIIQRATR